MSDQRVFEIADAIGRLSSVLKEHGGGVNALRAIEVDDETWDMLRSIRLSSLSQFFVDPKTKLQTVEICGVPFRLGKALS